MQTRIAYWSITVGVAGFLFGFDTAVISGADQPIQTLWRTSDLFHGAFIMYSALWGTVIGALLGNLPCERFGRKPTLIGIGILCLLAEYVGVGWRWMLGVEVIPALAFVLLVPGVPESPRWLLLRKNDEAA